MRCLRTSFGAKVCLVAVSRPLIGDGNPMRLPVLAVKVSTGKALEKGIEHYLTAEWKKGWSEWIEHAKDEFPSVLEHAVFTFFIDGCSRVCSHQLVRHRLVSFTQESQRYTEERIKRALLEVPEIYDAYLDAGAPEGPKEFWRAMSEILGERYKYYSGIPPEMKKIFVIPKKAKFDDTFIFSLMDYALCRAEGTPPEDCRYLLPQAVRTSLLATANLREWLHIVKLRAHPKAQWEVREVAKKIKVLLPLRFHSDPRAGYGAPRPS